jgi:hypothetical protein
MRLDRVLKDLKRAYKAANRERPGGKPARTLKKAYRKALRKASRKGRRG